ncbi:hypothetical protein [Yersinia ruckeri]|uniref:hypothetical protein n=1 Tax=Yersinia ruckeri TaxID=29486 RepID=UPI002237D204|nr:hypothetical protein [Yersinia ruckeri]EKN4689569.1 hypothetical protein [Yersinia ruckeri]MCW6615650.1 hypothetical protein [Yersinia ruckeri]
MICGAIMPDGISPFLKAYITNEDSMVVGYIGDGAMATLQALWESPFENDSVGSVAGISTLSNGAQAVTENTSTTRINSLMVWQGQKPPQITLPLHFMAKVDAQVEVQSAIMTLLQMASPELGVALPGGRRPDPVVLDIGRRLKLVDVVIQEVSFELDAPRTSDGLYTHNTVTLSISGMQVQNRSEIPYMFI